MKRLALAALAGFLTCGCARADAPIPPSPKHWVTDQAGYLSTGVASALDVRLKSYQDRTGHSVLVWISPERLTVSIEEFGFRTFNAWGVGRKGFDDGVVLFIFPSGDRLRMRIQVGYGLEQAIPDREAVRILRAVGPSMEAGQHDIGVVAIVNDILAAIEKDEKQ